MYKNVKLEHSQPTVLASFNSLERSIGYKSNIQRSARMVMKVGPRYLRETCGVGGEDSNKKNQSLSVSYLRCGWAQRRVES